MPLASREDLTENFKPPRAKIRTPGSFAAGEGSRRGGEAGEPGCLDDEGERCRLAEAEGRRPEGRRLDGDWRWLEDRERLGEDLVGVTRLRGRDRSAAGGAAATGAGTAGGSVGERGTHGAGAGTGDGERGRRGGGAGGDGDRRFRGAESCGASNTDVKSSVFKTSSRDSATPKSSLVSLRGSRSTGAGCDDRPRGEPGAATAGESCILAFFAGGLPLSSLALAASSLGGEAAAFLSFFNFLCFFSVAPSTSPSFFLLSLLSASSSPSFRILSFLSDSSVPSFLVFFCSAFLASSLSSLCLALRDFFLVTSSSLFFPLAFLLFFASSCSLLL